jgi:hypothetical protein
MGEPLTLILSPKGRGDRQVTFDHAQDKDAAQKGRITKRSQMFGDYALDDTRG